MKTLHLTLHRKAFALTCSGEKDIEYRKPSKWMLSRLHGKSYNRIRFTNGYGRTRPFVEAEFIAWYVAGPLEAHPVTFSTGFVVDVEEGDIMIKFKLLPKV